MRLHIFPPSPRAIKVIALAHYLELDCEMRIVDLFKGDQTKPEFAALRLLRQHRSIRSPPRCGS